MKAAQKYLDTPEEFALKAYQAIKKHLPFQAQREIAAMVRRRDAVLTEPENTSLGGTLNEGVSK